MYKTLLALIFTVLVNCTFAQEASIAINPDTILINFTAIEEANVELGKDWNATQYTPLKEPMNIKFNGRKLSMFYKSGKKFWEVDILEVQKKEKREYNRLEKEVYILKYKRKDFIQYAIIEYSYLIPGTMIEIKIPYFYYTGEVVSYTYLSN